MGGRTSPKAAQPRRIGTNWLSHGKIALGPAHAGIRLCDQGQGRLAERPKATVLKTVRSVSLASRVQIPYLPPNGPPTCEYEGRRRRTNARSADTSPNFLRRKRVKSDGVPIEPTDLERELVQQSGVVLRTGKLSLGAGTGSYRVKASMARVARAIGIERHEAHVTLTEITTTSHRGPSFRTEVAETRNIGINADRLCELERTISALPADSSVTEVQRELDRIEAKPPLYGLVLNGLWAGLACAAFAFLNGGGPVEMVGVFFGAWAGQMLRRGGIHRGFNQFGMVMLAALLACLVYLGFVTALFSLGAIEDQHHAGYVSAVLFLIPGFPLVTAALDLAKLDFSAGVARMTYAIMILGSAGLSVWGMSTVAGLSPDPISQYNIGFGLLLVLRLAASFLGVLGFALMFNSGWKMALGAASVGMLSNTVRIETLEAGLPPQAAAVIAALMVGFLTAWVAPRLRVPRITISVPAVVIMVPGVTLYRAFYTMSNGDTAAALAYAVEAGLVVVSIAIGLAVSRMLTDRTWAYDTPPLPSPPAR